MKFFHQLWRPGGWVRAPVQNCRYGLAETVNFTAVCACFFVAAKIFAKLKAGPVPDTSTKIFVVWKSLGWIHSRVPIQNSRTSPCQVPRKLMPHALCNSHRVPADTMGSCQSFLMRALCNLYAMIPPSARVVEQCIEQDSSRL